MIISGDGLLFINLFTEYVGDCTHYKLPTMGAFN